MQPGNQTTPLVNVRPFPDVRQKQITVSAPNTGMGPVWSADGTELFYVSFPADGIWAARVEYAPFKIGIPQRLFRRSYWYGGFGTSGAGGRAWDPDPNGKRFLMITAPRAPADSDTSRVNEPQIRVTLNWFTELKERAKAP